MSTVLDFYTLVLNAEEVIESCDTSSEMILSSLNSIAANDTEEAMVFEDAITTYSKNVLRVRQDLFKSLSESKDEVILLCSMLPNFDKKHEELYESFVRCLESIPYIKLNPRIMSEDTDTVVADVVDYITDMQEYMLNHRDIIQGFAGQEPFIERVITAVQKYMDTYIEWLSNTMVRTLSLLGEE